MQSNTNKCPECGGAMRKRTYRHTEIVGGIKVHDGSAQLPVCDVCETADMSLADLASYERRAAAIVLRSIESPTGAMLKYARKALGLTQEQLGQLLECAAETISRWENDGTEIQRSNQLALVAILDTVIQCGVPPSDLFEFMRRSESDLKDLEVGCDDEAA